METELNVGDIIYRAYSFGEEIILDAARVASISYAMLDLDELNATCTIEREDQSRHEINVKRIIEEFSKSRIKALTKLFNTHMQILQKVLVKMEEE